MIWLTWRQFRAQTIVTSAALAVVGVVLAATGLHLMHLFDASGVATCHSRKPGGQARCQKPATEIRGNFGNSIHAGSQRQE